MTPTTLDGVTTAINTAIADLMVQAPLVIVTGLGVAMIWWGAPKLVGLLKRIAK